MGRSVLFSTLFVLGSCQLQGPVSDSKRLFDGLFSPDRYARQLLPDCGANEHVNVSFNVALRQIIDLDEKAQMLSVNVWIRMTWSDCRLVWNSSDYGGLLSLLVDYGDVWAPDLANYDSLAEEEMMPGFDRYKARIEMNGQVTYLFPTVLRTICRVKVTYFPFDIQTCHLKFGSWSYRMSEIDFFPGNNGLPEDVNSYQENNEWVKLSFTSEFEASDFPVGKFRIITFYLHIQRRPTFYMLIIVFPCIFVNLIVLLGCCLPAESGEKVSLEVTILLSLAVFLLVISELLPPDSDNYPLLGLFFACSMILVGLRLVTCILVLNVHYRGRTGQKVPKWARRLVFCEKSTASTDKYRLRDMDTQDPDESYTDDYEGQNDHVPRQTNTNSSTVSNGGSSNITFSGVRNKPLPSRCCDKIINYLDSVENESSKDNEWMQVARFLDRFSIVCYSIAYATILVIFIVQMTSI